VQLRDVHPTLGFLALDIPTALQELSRSSPLPLVVVEKIFGDLSCRLVTHDLMQVARTFLDTPSRLGAAIALAPTAFDCSSLTKIVYAHAGIFLERYTHLQIEAGVAVTEPQAGDLLFTSGPRAWRHKDFPEGIGHVALATSPTSCMHAGNGSKKVTEIPIANLVHPVMAIRRLLPNVHQVTVVVLPDTLLSFSTPREFLAFLRKHLASQSRSD
jgi:hypothetical protein